VYKATANTYTVHHLAAKAIVMDLKTGESWLRGTMSNGKAAETAAKDLGTRLAISYHITSKWTSFVAVEKKRKEENVGRVYKAPKTDLAMLNKSRTAPIGQIQQAREPVHILGDIYSGPVHSVKASQKSACEPLRFHSCAATPIPYYQNLKSCRQRRSRPMQLRSPMMSPDSLATHKTPMLRIPRSSLFSGVNDKPVLKNAYIDGGGTHGGRAFIN
jgi:hypothetical protein